MKVLVTGFDLWSGVSINPSWENIKDLPTKVSGHTIKVAKISVFYSKIKNEMETLITTEKPDLIISFGLASSIQRPRIESYGWNWASNGADADGVNPNGRLNKEDNARVGYKTTFDYTQVQEWIKGSDFTSYASTDAGDFLCNANIFYSLQKLDKDLLNVPYMFVHVPSETTMALDSQKKFVKLIIQKAVQELNQSLDWSTATSSGTTTTPTTSTFHVNSTLFVPGFSVTVFSLVSIWSTVIVIVILLLLLFTNVPLKPYLPLSLLCNASYL